MFIPKNRVLLIFDRLFISSSVHGMIVDGLIFCIYILLISIKKCLQLNSNVLRHDICIFELPHFFVSVVDSSVSVSDFTCRRCMKSYRAESSLLRHIRYECSKEASFSCPYCSYAAKHKTSILRHVTCKHIEMYYEFQKMYYIRNSKNKPN